jgi:hypothetical protein
MFGEIGGSGVFLMSIVSLLVAGFVGFLVIRLLWIKNFPKK